MIEITAYLKIQLITTVYNLVDTYFVSTLGTNATAAVGVNSSLERTITIIGSLIGAGACSYISRLLGAEKKGDANRVLSTSILTGLGMGVIFMVVCRFFMEGLVYALGATDDCAAYSMQYATYVLYAAPFMIGSFILKKSLLAQCCCSTPYGTRLLGTWHRLIGKINSRRVPDLAI